MGSAEFNGLLPGELAALMEAWRERERRMDARIGVIAVLIAEPNRDRGKRGSPFKMSDFFPSLRRKAAPKTAEQEAAEIYAAFGVKP